MEKRGIRTGRGDLNREIEVTNQRLRQLKARISKLQKWLKEEQENTEPPTLADYIQGILSRKAQAGKPGYSHSFAKGYKARPHPKAVAKFKAQIKKLTSRSWGVSNEYKVYKLNQLIRGWVNYYKIGSMKGLCERLDRNIRYRLRMCIWKHWKTPKNRAKNLMKLDVPRWAAYRIAYSGARIARMCHNGWVQKAISNKRLADFGLISMLDYYTARYVTC